MVPIHGVIGSITPATFTPLAIDGGFIELAIFFVILAVIAAVLGARGVAGLSMTIAKWLVIIFIILAVISLFL